MTNEEKMVIRGRLLKFLNNHGYISATIVILLRKIERFAKKRANLIENSCCKNHASRRLFLRYKMTNSDYVQHRIKSTIHNKQEGRAKRLADVKRGSALWQVEIDNRTLYVIYNENLKKVVTFYTKQMAEKVCNKRLILS